LLGYRARVRGEKFSKESIKGRWRRRCI